MTERERVRVKSYESLLSAHYCIDESGRRRMIDLMASGCLDESTNPQDLVGKYVTFAYTHPYIELAEDVAIEEQEQEDGKV